MFYELAQKIIRNCIHIDDLTILLVITTPLPNSNKKTLDNLIPTDVK